MPPDDLNQTIDREGFLLVPSAISPVEINQLREAVTRAFDSGGLRRRNGSSFALRGLLRTVPEVREIADATEVRQLVAAVLGRGAWPVRSILFDKTPSANWSVAWHQDTTIAVAERCNEPGFGPWSLKDGVPHVRPPVRVLESMLSVRIHLDDAGPSSGALRVVPGSHRIGILDEQAIMEVRADGQFALCEARSGDILLMRPLLVHASASCVAPTHRRVIHIEYAVDPLPGRLRWANF